MSTYGAGELPVVVAGPGDDQRAVLPFAVRNPIFTAEAGAKCAQNLIASWLAYCARTINDAGQGAAGFDIASRCFIRNGIGPPTSPRLGPPICRVHSIPSLSICSCKWSP
jgi:hypothetical protein